MNLKGRNFLKLMDFTPEEITYMIDLAADLKAKKKQGIPHDSLTGKNIALIFEKTSTRTRCSFEVAAHDLGMHVTYADSRTNMTMASTDSVFFCCSVSVRFTGGTSFSCTTRRIPRFCGNHVNETLKFAYKMSAPGFPGADFTQQKRLSRRDFSCCRCQGSADILGIFQGSLARAARKRSRESYSWVWTLMNSAFSLEYRMVWLL